MKKCPTCEKTFEDSMRFCQVDGTPLVDDAPAFDPYATMVSAPAPSLAPDEDASKAEPIHETVGSIPISAPDDVLDLPEADPLKTMYASPTEMQEILGGSKGDIIDVPPVGEAPAPMPEPPSFLDLPSSKTADASPPPSPFSSPETSFPEPAPAPPVFADPPRPTFQEENIMNQGSNPNDWAPPPAPNAAWQDQPVGANTPFQPPPAGMMPAGQNKTLPIVSLVLGIISLCCYVSPITGIIALITGFLGMRNANNNPAEYGGKGLAIAGMVMGGLFFLASIAYWIFLLFFGGMAMIMDAAR